MMALPSALIAFLANVHTLGAFSVFSRPHRKRHGGVDGASVHVCALLCLLAATRGQEGQLSGNALACELYSGSFSTVLNKEKEKLHSVLFHSAISNELCIDIFVLSNK